MICESNFIYWQLELEKLIRVIRKNSCNKKSFAFTRNNQTKSVHDNSDIE